MERANGRGYVSIVNSRQPLTGWLGASLRSPLTGAKNRKETYMTMTQGIIFYTGKQRIGKLQITRLCFNRMNQYGITTDELEEVFRYGKEIEEGRIEYGGIGLFYVLDESRLFRGNLEDNKYIIIPCWKEVNK